jgi:hypothetical protein
MNCARFRLRAAAGRRRRWPRSRRGHGLLLRPLDGDTPLVLAAWDFIDEAPVGLEVDEVRTAAQDQRIANRVLQVPRRALD